MSLQYSGLTGASALDNDEARDDMIWFWLIGLIFVIGSIISIYRYSRTDGYGKPDREDLGFAGFFAVFISVMGTAILGVVCNGIMMAVLDGNNRLIERDISIVQIGTGSKTEGEFFLGSGYVDSEPVYTFYRDDDGAISQDWIPADFYTKIYQDSTQPRVTVYKNVPDNRWLSVFNSKGTGYAVHVPPNSIDRTVNLNLSGGS